MQPVQSFGVAKTNAVVFTIVNILIPLQTYYTYHIHRVLCKLFHTLKSKISEIMCISMWQIHFVWQTLLLFHEILSPFM